MGWGGGVCARERCNYDGGRKATIVRRSCATVNRRKARVPGLPDRPAATSGPARPGPSNYPIALDHLHASGVFRFISRRRFVDRSPGGARRNGATPISSMRSVGAPRYNIIAHARCTLHTSTGAADDDDDDVCAIHGGPRKRIPFGNHQKFVL